MVKRILIGFGVVLFVVLAVGTFVYVKYVRQAPLPVSDEDRAMLTVMPLPATASLTGEVFTIDPSFLASIEKSQPDSLINKALDRFLTNLGRRTNLDFTSGDKATFSIHYDSLPHKVQQPVENESYTLRITKESIQLTALHA